MKFQLFCLLMHSEWHIKSINSRVCIYVYTYLLRVPRIARTPCTGTSRDPTRNVMSHISGISRISFKLAHRALVLFIRALTSSCLWLAGILLPRDFCGQSDSLSETSVESYPEDESSNKKCSRTWMLNLRKKLLVTIL